ncbi:MAG: prephenate dehydrogenase/arogenate dehydrogenase family protein [Promethearchaeota archaeon]
MDKNVTVVGGSGAMGRWFGQYYRDKGCRVVLNARNRERLEGVSRDLGVECDTELRSAVSDADIVVVSVPIRATVDVLGKCARNMKEGALLFEVASVKGDIPEALRSIERETGVRCASVHPMFGGGAKTLEGHKVVVLPLAGPALSDAEESLVGLFEGDGAEVLVTTPETHDQLIALTLSATHFVNIAFGTLLRQSGQDLEEASTLGGTTFTLQKTMAEAVFQESAEVYAQIQFENPYYLKSMKEFQDWFSEYIARLEGGDYDWFKADFGSTREFLGTDPEFQGAYSKFYDMFGAIKKES